MAYTKNTTWVAGGAPGISHTALNNLETQYDEASTELGSSGGDIVVHGGNTTGGIYNLPFEGCYFTTDNSTADGGISYDPDNDLFSISFGGSTGELSTRAFAIAMAIVL